MYLVLRPPWAHRAVTGTPEGPPVVVVGPDAGVTKPKKPRKRGRPAAGQPAQPGRSDREGEGDEIDERDEPAPMVQLTAADRALEWRGEEVALPPRTIDMAGGGE